METTFDSDTFSDDAPDPMAGADPFGALTDADAIYFTSATKILHVWAVNNHLLIRFSFRRDELDWKDPIQINNAPQSQDFYHSAQAFQVVGLEIGATAWYQVVGMW